MSGSTFRTRAALVLVSLATIALELVLMRMLSLRFWSHFACMVISVALLGFGASGTALTLLRRQVLNHRRGWLCGLALAFAASVPLTLHLSRRVALDVQFLAWDFSQIGGAALLEGLMFVPFLLAGAFVGAALLDEPKRIAGHYAANLIGSGLGAVLAVVMMYFISPEALLAGLAAAAWLAGAILLPRRLPAGLGAAASAALVCIFSLPAMNQPIVSPYKMLSAVRRMPGTETIHRSDGPLGRIDVLAGPAIHYAPGLSLQWTDPIPPHVLLITDGDATTAVYDCKRTADWRFLDYTTAASAYCFCDWPRVLVLGAGGGSDIGLALYHRSREVVALEMNEQVIEAMGGVLAGRGGRVYSAPGVRVVEAEARGYLAARNRSEKFRIVQLPAIDAFGASGAGLYAAQESYLYTVEAFAAMLDALDNDGVLCVTRWARTPPRDGLRIFDTAAEALRRKGKDPVHHVAMIRSWATVTVLAFASPVTPRRAYTIRAFCRRRSFDLCYLPDLNVSEANRFHQLDQPYYYQAARALLGPGRREFLDDYLFDVAAATDDKPYFFHFFRWRAMKALRRQLGGVSRAYLETGYLMLLAALAQALVSAVVLIVLPLLGRLRTLRSAAGRARMGKAPALGYFLAIGVGFMLLEMGFLQKLILYLAHPIYSAAVVIAGFLVFGGLGSMLSGVWPAQKRMGSVAAAVVAAVAAVYLLVLDDWLAMTQGWAVWVRFGVAAGTIAPLALAMGHMFPAGLRRLGAAAAPLVPWAWAVNGFASVAATVAAPLIAMKLGFAKLTLIAAACYIAAGVLFLFLPRGKRVQAPAEQPPEPVPVFRQHYTAL